MKVSVAIIAHDEEAHIAECIESILQQTQKADEIVLVLHNSTDKTKEIAERYPITIVPYQEPSGILCARMEALSRVNGDVILCIDGDSYAQENWISEMTRTLHKNNILVGSLVKFKGTYFDEISNMFRKYFCAAKGKRATFWIWGPSFGFWGRDKEKIRAIYEESVRLSKELGLSRNPEDYWLALFMSKEGDIEVTNKTYVVTNVKHTTTLEAMRRHRENVRNGLKMLTFFKKYNM